MRVNQVKNKSWDFLLPLVGIPIIDYFSLYNVYLFSASHNIPDNCLFVCFQWNGHKKYEPSLNIIRSNPQYRGEFSYHNYMYTVFIMEILPQYHKEIELFKLGKYSEFSEEAKIVICRFRECQSVIKQVLYKEEPLKLLWEKTLDSKLPDNSELWSIYNSIEETLDVSILEVIPDKYSVY